MRTWLLQAHWVGLQPAFLLSQGFPQKFTPLPFIDPTALNGQWLNAANNGGGNYRPFDANRLHYSQQWNLTIEHQYSYRSTAYVGNKGTRPASTVASLNALDPSHPSMGQQLFDQFTPDSGQTSLDGVPVPYVDWIEQMKACSPIVAQALLPDPQYFSGIVRLNENAGNSVYHSFQVKAEKRFSHATSMLASHTLSKLLTSSEDPQAFAQGFQNGVISPYQRERNKSLSVDDVPQILSVVLIYQLPFGKGQRFLNGGRVLNKLVGGWEVTSIFRVSSAIPFHFRNGQCNLPGQFRAACVPAIVPGANPFAQSTGSFEPANPLFNKAAFEATGALPGGGFNLGKGPRISNVRGFGFHNHDFGLTKETSITERVTFEIRAEFFNIWNRHCFSGNGTSSAFNTDVSSASFGVWNGTITPPRNIQVGGKITF